MPAPVPEKTDRLPDADNTLELQHLHRHMQQARHMMTQGDVALGTGIQVLDELFAGSVCPGKIIEWGIPHGRNGRVIPLLFLRHNPLPAVWIYADRGFRVYAPAWASYGIDLQRLFFIRSNHPVTQLRPLFMDNLFSFLVVDSPQRLSRGELAFISQRARCNGQVVFLVRDYFLSRNRGTAQASVRVNCWQNNQGGYSVNFIKGQHTKKISLSASVVLHHDV